MVGFVTDAAGDWVALLSCGHRQHLTVDQSEIVVPEVPHHVELVGPVRFFVEFLRAAAASE